ncbi:MAG: hypothetical protein L0228_14955 [Planctomycetes bacterium]|nr:hypothetical protein [Planctomycetota bacterium]
MRRSLAFLWWFRFVAIAIVIAGQSVVRAQWEERDDGDRPVYQRRAFEWNGHRDDRRKHRFHKTHIWVPPQVNAGWFQRPYPYHLDYYKMRYGGSYAPYFGNLYGPPQVVTAPPYYGPYGDFQFANPGGGAYPAGYPAAPNGVMNAAPAEQSAPANGDELPSP